MNYQFKHYNLINKLNNMDHDELYEFYNYLKNSNKHYDKIRLLKLIDYLNNNNIEL